MELFEEAGKVGAGMLGRSIDLSLLVQGNGRGIKGIFGIDSMRSDLFQGSRPVKIGAHPGFLAVGNQAFSSEDFQIIVKPGALLSGTRRREL